MGRILARITIFTVSTLLLLYAIAVATLTFKGLNITAFHLSRPLLIGYGVFWLFVAPSGLWGFFGSIKNNPDLYTRYLRDHWFSSALVTIVDIIKIVFSFTMKNNSIQKCLASNIDNESCNRKIDFNQKAGLVAFGAQELLLVSFGVLVWFSCRRLVGKKRRKIKETLEEQDLEIRNSRELNDDSIRELGDQRQNMSLERMESSPFTRHQSQHNERNDPQNVKKNKKIEPVPNTRRSSEEGGNKKNLKNSKNGKNDTQRFDQQNLRKSYDRQITSPPGELQRSNFRNSKNDKNDTKSLQRSDQQRLRRSYDRQIKSPPDEFDELQRQGPPPMNPMAPINRSKSTNMAPPINNNNMLPYPPPMPLRYSQQGMQNGRIPIPPYYNRPLLPQFQPIPMFQQPYPLQQQWMEPRPPQGDFLRGHRRSKSHPELRLLPFAPPNSTDQQVPPIPPQFQQQTRMIERQRVVPPSQVIERQQEVIPPPERKQRNPQNPVVADDDNDNDTRNTSNSRRSSTSSRYRPSLSPILEQKRPYSQMHRTNSLPNLGSHEDLMRNELLLAPPVPLIPLSLQPGNNDSNSKNKKDNKSSKSDDKNTRESQQSINNADKFERFIKMYGNKDYNMASENSHYNKYSKINNDDKNGWNTNENDNYVPPKRPRPKSAHSVKGEASPRLSMYVDDSRSSYYYHDPSLDYQETMNNGNSYSYAYPQYVGPTGYYNYAGNYVPVSYGNNGWFNYNQQRSQGMNYYY